MKILKNSIPSLASEGYITLQIPTLSLSFDPNFKEETEEVPDEWIIMDHNGRLAAGKETGFPHLSPKGWIANKDKIKEAFLEATQKGLNRGSWEDFEKHVTQYHASIRKKTSKELDTFQTKVQQLTQRLNSL